MNATGTRHPRRERPAMEPVARAAAKLDYAAHGLGGRVIVILTTTGRRAWRGHPYYHRPSRVVEEGVAHRELLEPVCVIRPHESRSTRGVCASQECFWLSIAPALRCVALRWVTFARPRRR